jgi:hypothetical protein
MSYKQQNRRQYQKDIRRQSVKGSLHGRGNRKRYPGINVAREAFEARSERSKGQDLVRLAQIAPNVQIWLKDPSRWDLPNVDTPDAQRIFEHRTTRQKAQDLARRARKTRNIELWMGNINKMDLQGVDTPVKGKRVRRFRIMEKEEAKKILLEEKVKEKRESTRKLPTKEEILERAQERFQEKQAKEGLPAITAEEQELKESGLFEVARAELMRGEKSKADAQIEEYVHNLNSELEPLGFQVVPIS